MVPLVPRYTLDQPNLERILSSLIGGRWNSIDQSPSHHVSQDYKA